MVVSDEEVAALRAKLEREKKDLERIRRERSVGSSFDGLGGGNSSDRRGTAASTMGPMWTRGVSAAGDLRQNLPNFPRGIVPKFPVECSPSEYIAWERRFEVFISDQGLRHTISPDAPEIAVIRCINNAYLFGQFGEDLVLEHRRVWGYISEATADAPFENSLYKCHSSSDALRMMREWSLPLYPAERHLLVAELERLSWGTKTPNFSLPALAISRQRCVLLASRKMHQKLFSSFSASSRNVHRTPMLLSSVVVFETGGPWESESNEGMTIWYLAVVACLSSRSSNGLPAVDFLISINVALMLSLPPGRRDNSYRAVWGTRFSMLDWVRVAGLSCTKGVWYIYMIGYWVVCLMWWEASPARSFTRHITSPCILLDNTTRS